MTVAPANSTSTMTALPDPKTWEQAMALSLITGDANIIKAYREQHITEFRETHKEEIKQNWRLRDGPHYGLDCAPKGIDYEACHSDASGPYCLANLDPVALKSSLEKRATIFRAAAQEMGLDIEQAYYFRHLKGLDGDTGNLSDYELGVGLETLTLRYTCGAASSDPLGSHDIPALPNRTEDIRRPFTDIPDTRIVAALYEKTEGKPLPASPYFDAVEAAALFGADGSISKADWIRHFQDMDRNGNNKLDEYEDVDASLYRPILTIGTEKFSHDVKAAAAAKFTYLDVDKDGVLTTAEFETRVALRQSVQKGLSAEAEQAFQAFLAQPSQTEKLAAELQGRKDQIIADGKAEVDAHVDQWTRDPMFFDYCMKTYKRDGHARYLSDSDWVWDRLAKDPAVTGAFDTYLKTPEGAAAYAAAREKNYNDNMRYYQNQANNEQPSERLIGEMRADFMKSYVGRADGLKAKELLKFDLKYEAETRK